MKYITEYRNPKYAEALVREIGKVAGNESMTFMEVCGTHTMAIARFGIRQILPKKNIRLISGPGCPVCVTPNQYIDHATALSRLDGIITCTFGDMMRVPGSSSSLENERANGCDIRIVYSTTDALEIAEKNPRHGVIFLGVGFETTAPTIAAAIKMASERNLVNFSVLGAHKVIPPALEALLAGEVKLDGFLLPGHVSTIIGAAAYRPVLAAHNVSGAIAGFEPTDILEAILELVRQKVEKQPSLHTSYTRAVTEEGNKMALALLNEVFETCDALWRGIGVIPSSGLAIREPFKNFDAAKKYSVEIGPTTEPKGCRCGEILRGLVTPTECPLFSRRCTPAHPVGACMVSSEGTCAAYYKYGDKW